MEFDALVLGGGGAKGVVYPQALRSLEEKELIDLRKIPHVIGSSAGALTGFILATGGTSYAIEKFMPTISESLPFATKKFANKSELKIGLQRLLPWSDVSISEDKLDGSSIPSVLLIWTRFSLQHLLSQVCQEVIQEENGDWYIDTHEGRIELWDLQESNGKPCFWDYHIPLDADLQLIKQLRDVLIMAMRDLDIFGVYLASTHEKIVHLLKSASIYAGWKHLSVTVTRLLSSEAGHKELAGEFGSLNYVSSPFFIKGHVGQMESFNHAYLSNKSICLMAAAQASGSFPLLFGPALLGPSPSLCNFRYTDGGCICNMPIEVPVMLNGVLPPRPKMRILALGLNNNNEASEVPSEIRIPVIGVPVIEHAMLPSLQKHIVMPQQNSQFAQIKKIICKNVVETARNKHGWLFEFKGNEKEIYKIFYLSKLPLAPIRLTSEIKNMDDGEVKAAIRDYSDGVCSALDDLLGKNQLNPIPDWGNIFRQND